jgi:hypothetical protein
MRIVTLAGFFLILAGLAGFAQPGGPGGQNDSCQKAKPFCTGTQYNFPAGVNAGSGQSGPCYNCLATRPNPAWYYMKVATSGNIIIQMHSQPSEDIDYCCWGPFTSQYCCDQLLCNKVVSCSYSPNPQETCTINNAVTGQYYMLVITNFSNNPCNIIFSQTGGTGTTDCTILAPACSNNSPICVTQTLQLTANSVANATYHWSGPAGFISNIQNPSIPNAQMSNAGDYYMKISVNGQPSADSSKTTAYIYNPAANAGNDTTIPYGTIAYLHGSASQGSGHYRYRWAPGNLLVDSTKQNPVTKNLSASTIFTLSVTDSSASCLAQDMMTVQISGGPLGVSAAAEPSTLCAGESTQLHAIGSGGAGNYTYQWTGPNGFSSNLQNPTVQPAVTSTYNVGINDGFNTSNSSVTVTVNQLPIANAGANKSIPYGTYIYLDGSVPGGSSYYFYSWSPADKLVNASQQFPQTVNLTATTIYSLQVTDLVTGCISQNTANVTVEVTGGALNANPAATPEYICLGDTAQIHALAGGGNVGHYQYTWTSDPAGFSSTDPDPRVTPAQTTTYHVSVNDGFNTTAGSTVVTLYPQPVIHLGPADTTVCIYDTLRLDAGNPGSTYLWDHGATTRTLYVVATGITDETQYYGVKVTTVNGCTDHASIVIHLSFNGCTGIEDPFAEGKIRMYPNPAASVLHIEAGSLKDPVEITLNSIYGKKAGSWTMPAASAKITQNIGLEGLPRGIYLVRFTSGSFIHTEKLVIE